jgi:hypothetical protein
MAKALYVAIFSREKWWVDLEGKAHGPYESLAQAAEEGEQLARFAAHSGRDCELLLPDERGHYYVYWASEHEPHAEADYAVNHAA